MQASKRVRFPDDDQHGPLSILLCTVPHREDFSKEEQENLYFSRGDYHMSRSAAKVVSKESERLGYSKTLRAVFQEKSKEAQDSLNLWAASGHCRRGLERWANKEHGEIRQREQFNAVMAVLRAQDDMLCNKGQVSGEALRKVSYKATKTSRHFARMMGKADSYAVAATLKGSDDGSLATAITFLTMQSEEDNVSKRSLSWDDQSVDVTITGGDELKDSCHGDRRSGSRLRRFGFGRKQREPKVPATEPRVSRVA